MEPKNEAKDQPKLIHLARIIVQGGEVCYLLLRKIDFHQFSWFERIHGAEKETPVQAFAFEEAMQKARKHWKLHEFRTVNCGFRYTLPERDEHGTNALFHQMAASYSAPNGIYFDDELGNNCIVNFASAEARSVWKELKQEGLL